MAGGWRKGAREREREREGERERGGKEGGLRHRQGGGEFSTKTSGYMTVIGGGGTSSSGPMTGCSGGPKSASQPLGRSTETRGTDPNCAGSLSCLNMTSHGAPGTPLKPRPQTQSTRRAHCGRAAARGETSHMTWYSRERAGARGAERGSGWVGGWVGENWLAWSTNPGREE